MKRYVWFAACLMAALLVVAGANTALATCPTLDSCVCISTDTCQVLDTGGALTTPSPLDTHITVTSSSGTVPNVNATCDGIIERDKGPAVGWDTANAPACNTCTIQVGGVDYVTNDWTETISASGKDDNLVNVSLKCHFPGTE